MLRALRSPVARFAVVGLLMSALHLVVFHLVAGRVVAEVANLVAFLVVTQLNFVVSDRWTWASRRVRGRSLRVQAARLLAFNATAASGFALNALAFSVAYRLLDLPATPSAVVGVLAGAGATFLLSSRVVFRRPGPAAGARVDLSTGRHRPGPSGRGRHTERQQSRDDVVPHTRSPREPARDLPVPSSAP